MLMSYSQRSELFVFPHSRQKCLQKHQTGLKANVKSSGVLAYPGMRVQTMPLTIMFIRDGEIIGATDKTGFTDSDFPTNTVYAGKRT